MGMVIEAATRFEARRETAAIASREKRRAAFKMASDKMGKQADALLRMSEQLLRKAGASLSRDKQ